jgi:hypothetical protein
LIEAPILPMEKEMSGGRRATQRRTRTDQVNVGQGSH